MKTMIFLFSMLPLNLALAQEENPAWNLKEISEKHIAYLLCVSNSMTQYLDSGIQESAETLADAALGNCDSEKSKFTAAMEKSNLHNQQEAQARADEEDGVLRKKAIAHVLNFRMAKLNKK
jgi:hypothetical protein